MEDQTGTPQDTQQQPQPQNYVATVPVEAPDAHPGRIEGIIAIVCAVIALAFFPIIFGPAGIILAVRAKKKGARTLGVVALTLSIVFMILGMIFGFSYAMLGEKG
jgi:ABC-type Na+ efflux pump permease subunit